MINPSKEHFALLDFRLIQPFTAGREMWIICCSIRFGLIVYLVLLVLILLDSSLGLALKLFCSLSLLVLFGAETLLYSNRNGSKDKIDRWPGKKWLPQWRSLPNFYLFYIARWICLSISISQSDRRCSFSVKVSCYSAFELWEIIQIDFRQWFGSFISHSTLPLWFRPIFFFVLSLILSCFSQQWTIALLPFQISIKKQNAAKDIVSSRHHWHVYHRWF